MWFIIIQEHYSYYAKTKNIEYFYPFHHIFIFINIFNREPDFVFPLLLTDQPETKLDNSYNRYSTHDHT